MDYTWNTFFAARFYGFKLYSVIIINKVSQQSYNDEINKHDDNMFMSVDRICSLLHGTCTTVCIMLLDEREYNNRE